LTCRRRDLGAKGEALAARYLEVQGFRIRERNVRFRRGEIDIVAQDGPILVFVEVKTRRSRRFGSPLESVDPRKRRKLWALARTYLYSRRLDGVDCRFDVIGITWEAPGKPPVIEHVRDALGHRA